MPLAVLQFGSATADHCESNYAVSPWIAEWWNTVSSLFMFAVGLGGMAVAVQRRSGNGRLLPVWFPVMYLALGVVGLGSAWFHGTLSWAGQMADQIPMLWTEVALMYGLVATEASLRRAANLRGVLPLLAAALCVFLVTSTTVALTSTSPTVFRVLFGVFVAGTIAQVRGMIWNALPSGATLTDACSPCGATRVHSPTVCTDS